MLWGVVQHVARSANPLPPWPPTTPQLSRPRPQIQDHYFGNVCELDLVFGFHKVYCLLDEFIIGGEIQETSKKVCARGWVRGE